MTKTLIAMAVAGALAVPFVAQASAGSDNIQIAQAGSAGPGATPSRGNRADQPAAASGSSGALFDRLDKNRDGFISRDEAKDATELQGRFAESDKDNDGKLSRGEMGALESGSSATGTTSSGRSGGASTGMGGSTGGMGGSSGPAGSSSGPNPAGEAPRGGISR
jgi:EF hand domain-containing protein